MARVELYPVFLIDQRRNTVQKMVNPRWKFSRFIEMINIETGLKNNAVMIGTTEYNANTLGNRSLHDLPFRQDLHIVLLNNFA